MTYQELNDRLTNVQSALTSLQSGTYQNVPGINVQETISQLQSIKEALDSELKILAEQEAGTVSTDSEIEAEKLAKKGINVKLTKEAKGEARFSVEETKQIARGVGKSLAKALIAAGDELSHMKAINIEEGSFNLHVEYKDNRTDNFSFYVEGEELHLVDFSYNKAVGEIGIKPSGEPVIHVDVIANELTKHFSSKMQEGEGNMLNRAVSAANKLSRRAAFLKGGTKHGIEVKPNLRQYHPTPTSEMTDNEFSDAQQADRLKNHPEKTTIEKIQALIATEKNKNKNTNKDSNTITFTLDDGDLDDKFLSDESLSRNLGYKKDGRDTYYVLPKRDFDRFQDWADSSGYDTDEVIDVIDEIVKENVNPELDRLVNGFIRKLADRYDYSLQDAVYAVTQVLRKQNYDGVNEITPAQQKYADKAASRPSKPKKTQFRKDIEGAKRMIDSGKSQQEVIKRFGIEAYNAVGAENEYLEERKIEETSGLEFKVGDKVKYLGHPGVITKAETDIMDRPHYSVSYNKGTGDTKATNIYNKGGEIKKAISETKDAIKINEASGIGFLLLSAAMLQLTAVLSRTGVFGNTTLGDVMDSIKDANDRRIVRQIARKLKDDQEIKDFLKLPPSEQKGKWRKLIATKLQPNEMKLLNIIYKKHFEQNESRSETTKGNIVSEDLEKTSRLEFKVGDKVKYLGHPGVITKAETDIMDRPHYSVSYNKGTGDTKATNIYNKGGVIKKSIEEGKHKVKFSKSNNTYQVWKGDKIITDFATKKRAEDETKKLNLLSITEDEDVNDDMDDWATDKDHHINEKKGTCCGKCGRVHVKGSKCKTPFLKGKDHCRTK